MLDKANLGKIMLGQESNISQSDLSESNIQFRLF